MPCLTLGDMGSAVQRGRNQTGLVYALPVSPRCCVTPLYPPIPRALLWPAAGAARSNGWTWTETFCCKAHQQFQSHGLCGKRRYASAGILWKSYQVPLSQPGNCAQRDSGNWPTASPTWANKKMEHSSPSFSLSLNKTQRFSYRKFCKILILKPASAALQGRIKYT